MKRQVVIFKKLKPHMKEKILYIYHFKAEYLLFHVGFEFFVVRIF